MDKQHIYKVEGMNCHSCEILIKDKLSKLPNIKFVEVSSHRGEVLVEYEGDLLSLEKINDIFKEEKFIFSNKESQNIESDNLISRDTKEHIFNVEGMHCASCELIVEKKLLEIDGIKSVEASTKNGQVTIEYEGKKPNNHYLSSLFKEENYTFFDKSNEEVNKTKSGISPTLFAFNVSLFIIIAFLFLNKSGVSEFISVNSKSSLVAFWGFGLLAGFSSCAALVGGMVLSMSKQWQSLHSDKNTTYEKLQPHLLFNAGRVMSYAFFGALLGGIGSKLQISFTFTSFLIIAISFLMIAMGLQMLGVKSFRKFQFTLPKSATRYISNENNFQGKQMPFMMGALTFFLPCGFTITAQGLALLSGSWLQGSLIMLFFVLGTVPMLLFIGLSSVKFSSKPHLAERFSKIAGFLVLFFALFNISNQANVLGFTGFSNIVRQSQTKNVVNEKDLPRLVDGKQIIAMTASGSGDSPNYFKVRAGVPVKWEITAGDSLGCNGAIISNSLFSGTIDLIPGQLTVKEFTPQTPGKYRFSCTMGMISGIIEVVDANSTGSVGTDNNNVASAATTATADNSGVVPSGSKGCGCGGGGGNSCGGAKTN